jgi:hypothetical protein
MKRIGVSFMASDLETLKREAAAENCSIGDLVRRIIGVWVRTVNYPFKP